MKLRQIAAAVLAAALFLNGCSSTTGKTAAAGTEQAKQPEKEQEQDPTEQDLNHLTGKTEIQYQDGIPYVKGEIFAMDTYMSISCYGDACEEALEESFEEIIRLDNLLSIGEAESEISVINRDGEGNISEDTCAMLEKSLLLYEKTGGYFDITVLPMMELWGFTSGDFAVPDPSAIGETLSLVDSGRISLDLSARTVALGEKQGIDLGGIAKGFTSDRIMQIFAKHHLKSGLVSLGGNVEVYGSKTDGSSWRCGITNPLDPKNMTSFLGVATVKDCAVITSGGYERFFTDEKTGKEYHHIIDPHTGYPSESGILSATIVSPSGLLADGLSTSVYAMGLEKACDFWKEYGEMLGFDMILMTEDEEVWATKPLKDTFTSDYKIHWVE